MADRFIQLLCMTCNVCMILYVSSLQGVKCDVPDGVVYTDLHKTAEKGDELVLKCQFYGTPNSVSWKRRVVSTESPNLITWEEGEFTSGSCVHGGSCYMSDDFSLVIKNVTVSDQGTYNCRVSNYKGILIHNFTEVNVFAPPLEPFPLIDECPRILPNYAEQTCSLSTSGNFTITCSASSYFPHIDLFFSHGSKKIDATHIKEDANMDGTKNKSISTVAEPSESPYVCVASDIPGSEDKRTVTVTVTFLLSLSSSRSGGVAKIVVPVTIFIIIILAVICAAVVWRRRKQRGNKGKEKDVSDLLQPLPDPHINERPHREPSQLPPNPNIYGTQVCLLETSQPPPDPNINVEPDKNGYYKQTMEPANPTQEQLDPEKNYKMDDKEKGRMFLFNMSKYRKGSDVDVRNIYHVFTEIGYKIETHSDLTAKDLKDKLETFADSPDHEGMCSAVFVIMGHGSMTGIDCTDELVTYTFIMNKVSRMKFMKGKPKMIFFQSSRGKAKVETEADIEKEKTDTSDLLVVHSTTWGNKAYRDTIGGAWFIQMLCKELLENAHVSDLSTMLDQVTGKVRKKTIHDNVQTPEVTKQGISKKIYFLPKYPPAENE